MFHQDIISIYTDGVARGNPGPGGWAAIAVCGNTSVSAKGGKSLHTTNNKMELQGAIEGLKVSLECLKGYKKIHVHSDSKYVLQGITEWIHNWKKNNWRTAAKKEVLNQELWKELDAVVEQVSKTGAVIMWTYVKGHSENKFNARADVVATTCADDKTLGEGVVKDFYIGDFDGWKL